MADDAIARPALAYPRSAGAYEMAFHSHHFGFSIALADNGLIFEEYDPATDEIRRKLASTPAQAQRIFDDWAQLRSAEILKRSQRYFEELRVQDG